LTHGQTQDTAAARPNFAVATVKPADLSLRQQIDMRALPGGAVTATAVTLKFLISVAYQVQNVQISGGPSWIATAEFDVLAKPAEGEKPELRAMLQALLEDRFKLSVHRETKQLSVYELKLAKPGAGLGRNLKISSEGKCSADPPVPGTVPCGGFVRRQGYLTGRNAPLSALCSPLSLILDRPVLDKTGMSNAFDLTLEWTPDSIGESARADVQPGAKSDLPSLFTALEEQLGLKLEGAKAPTEVLVVDHVETPSGN
jgi:uncharacterized protein (TIGR03435 family)